MVDAMERQRAFSLEAPALQGSVQVSVLIGSASNLLMTFAA